jgi:dienelactone hydrolase
MSKHGIVAGVFAALLLTGGTAAALDSNATIVELESPLARPQQLQGLLRRPAGAGPFPAVVLLHSCNGNWKRLDERWGSQIAPWGYVTLTVDSFGPRGVDNTCSSGSPADMAFDAYRALDFLVREHAVDPDRVAVLGFSQGGWLALSSVEQGVVEHSSSHKFRAAAAFYPPCRTISGNLTVPALILIGELDDWTSAEGCRQLAEGGDDYGVSRRREGAPIKLIVYPGAWHAFDAPALKTPRELLGHHLEYNQAAADQSAVALREFLDATLRAKEPEN